jgi:DNA polymerase-3 subunit alpha
MRRFLVQLEASDINDLVAMSALYRPGPMEFIPRYIARKHGEEEVAYMTDDLRSTLDRGHDDAIVESEKNKLREDLDPILGLTYGIPVYQEQLMFLVQAMA